jgi:hypothetical protein
MSAMSNAVTVLDIPLLTPWMEGPADASATPITVSVTEFHPQSRRLLPGIALRGLRMRMGWYAMQGAIGMWLWTLPASQRAGSISVWSSEDDLARFVALPHHVEIMQRYGSRGSVRSTTWQADLFDPRAVVERARTWITEWAA